MRPDFACTDLAGLAHGDLRFLIEHLPRASGTYEEISALLHAMPDTTESMLTSDYVFNLIRDRRHLLLDISPFLLFSVLLRRSLGRPHSNIDRRVVNYVANLLALFVEEKRVQHIEPGDRDPRNYVIEMLQGLDVAEPRRQFVTYAHVGNYALWLTGLRAAWLQTRHQYGRRPVSPRYYEDCGRAYFDRAAKHRLAREYGLDDVFLRLAMLFTHYREGLNRMNRDFMSAA